MLKILQKKKTYYAKKYNVFVSIVEINPEKFNLWKKSLSNYPNWFAKIYGVIVYHAITPILSEGYLQMDREYDENTMLSAGKTILSLINNKIEVYIRKENEYPTNRIIVADLFARGYFRGFDCSGLIINRNPDISNEIYRIFKKK